MLSWVRWPGEPSPASVKHFCLSSPGMVSAAPAWSPPEASPGWRSLPSPEDASTPFAIPRTSSLARAKAAIVSSFAEGTKFAPQVAEAPGGALQPAPKAQEALPGTQPGPESQEIEEPQAHKWKQMGPLLALPAPGIQLLVAAAPTWWRTVAERVEAIEAASRRAQALSAQSICWQGHRGDLRALSGLSSAVLVASREARQNPRSKSAIPKPPPSGPEWNRGSPRLDSGSAHQSPSSAMKGGLTGALESAGTGSEEGARSLGGGIKSSGGGQEVA